MYQLSHNCIYGTDANPRMARTSKMNMIMHGDGHGGVHHHDGLLNVNGIFEERFDVILTNPPFGQNVDKNQIISEADKFTDEEMKKKYWDARHNCYAFILGEHGEVSRCTDDGEPSGTAGRPILEVLHGAGVHDILVIVTRYFGGTLLGTGGLVRAYSQAAQAGLAASTIIDKLMGYRLEICTDYNGIGKLQYIFGQMGLPLMDTVYAEDVVVTVAVPDSDKDSLINKVTEATAGQAQISGQEEHIYFGVRDGEVLLFD